MKDLIFGVGSILGGTIFLIVCLMNWECNGYQSMTGKETKLVAGSCYIKDGSQWYRWEEYKYRLVAKGDIK